MATKSHAHNVLSNKLCSINGCTKRIKERHKDTHDKCFKHHMKYVRNNPRTGMSLKTKEKLGLGVFL